MRLIPLIELGKANVPVLKAVCLYVYMTQLQTIYTNILADPKVTLIYLLNMSK